MWVGNVADFNSLAPPVKGMLHNLNSEAFGSGGAIRLGDYKLIVEPKVSEAEVYTYAQHVLQVILSMALYELGLTRIYFRRRIIKCRYENEDCHVLCFTSPIKMTIKLQYLLIST